MMRTGLLLLTAILLHSGTAAAFDQQHSGWNDLLRKHVVLLADGHASVVDYRALLQNQAELRHYIAGLSAVAPEEFSQWTKNQRLAFLINAYNAFTVELILSAYPDLQSIKDLGSFFSSPWKKNLFPLLGRQRSLDDIEHGLIRAPGAYDEPRIHFAVNCASVSCPALRNEAYVADRLDQQLEDNTLRFLSDRSRNRFNPHENRLEVSKLFDWYGEDFSRGWGGSDSVDQFLGRYADRLTDREKERQAIRSGRVPIRFLDYNWRLNDLRPGK